MKTKSVGNGKAKITNLRLDAIRLDAGIQIRAHIEDCTVAEYAEAMLRGNEFPPIAVFHNGGDYILADGWHRIRAARRAKLGRILAEVRPGGRRDALRFALGCNQAHGLRRSSADKRRAVQIGLREFRNLSDRLVAQMCGVSQPFVSNLRHQLITVIGSNSRLGRDGKLRTLPVRGTKVGAGPQAGVSAARPRPASDVAGGSNGEAENPAFMAVADAMATLETMVESLVHDHPDNTAAVVAMVAKLRADLLLLEGRVRSQGEP